MRIGCDEGIALLKEHGCTMTDNNMVLIPSYLVEECLRILPFSMFRNSMNTFAVHPPPHFDGVVYGDGKMLPPHSEIIPCRRMDFKAGARARERGREQQILVVDPMGAQTCKVEVCLSSAYAPGKNLFSATYYL